LGDKGYLVLCLPIGGGGEESMGPCCRDDLTVAGGQGDGVVAVVVDGRVGTTDIERGRAGGREGRGEEGGSMNTCHAMVEGLLVVVAVVVVVHYCYYYCYYYYYYCYYYYYYSPEGYFREEGIPPCFAIWSRARQLCCSSSGGSSSSSSSSSSGRRRIIG